MNNGAVIIFALMAIPFVWSGLKRLKAYKTGKTLEELTFVLGLRFSPADAAEEAWTRKAIEKTKENPVELEEAISVQRKYLKRRAILDLTFSVLIIAAGLLTSFFGPVLINR